MDEPLEVVLEDTWLESLSLLSLSPLVDDSTGGSGGVSEVSEGSTGGSGGVIDSSDGSGGGSGGVLDVSDAFIGFGYVAVGVFLSGNDRGEFYGHLLEVLPLAFPSFAREFRGCAECAFSRSYLIMD